MNKYLILRWLIVCVSESKNVRLNYIFFVKNKLLVIKTFYLINKNPQKWVEVDAKNEFMKIILILCWLIGS